MVHLQVEEMQPGYGSFQIQAVGSLCPHQDIPIFGKIAIALRTCRELWGDR